MLRRVGCVCLLDSALFVVVSPASASQLQTTSGTPYTGPVAGQRTSANLARQLKKRERADTEPKRELIAGNIEKTRQRLQVLGCAQ